MRNQLPLLYPLHQNWLSTVAHLYSILLHIDLLLAVYNTWHLRDLISPTQSHVSLNSCINQIWSTSRRQNRSSVISQELAVMEYSFTRTLLSPYTLTLMQIGPATWMITSLQTHISFILVVTWSPGRPRNRKELHAPLHKLNTVLWQIQFLR